MNRPELLAGTGRRCINPPPNIAHGGWGAQKHEQAEGIDMSLWATALALSDGSTKALLLDIDIQILTNERADQIRSSVAQATGLSLSNIRAAATHTHSGPVPYKSWIEKGYEMVAPWFANVAMWCAEAAVEALDNLQPVFGRAARGHCEMNVNRRASREKGERFLGVNTEGKCDHEVIVVALEPGTSLKLPFADKPSATTTLVNYACHPTIMGPPNRLITPDYPGAMKRVVESAIGGRCLFFQGSAGDQGPRLGFQADASVYRNFGAILGHEVAKLVLSAEHLPAKSRFREVIPSGAPLGMYEGEFDSLRLTPLRIIATEIGVPLREALPERTSASANLEHWKNRLKAAREQNDHAAITEAIYMARRADIQLRMADDFGGRTSAGVRTHIVAFGDVAIIGCNIEPFCEIGLDIKKQSPFPVTFMCGYTNGRMAYLPTSEEWDKGGYEVENSPFGKTAATVLTTEILKLLKDIQQRR